MPTQDELTEQLISAISSKDNNTVRDILKNPDFRDVNHENEYGASPFYWACRKGNFEAVKMLLEKKGINKNFEHRNGKGITLLQHALIQYPFICNNPKKQSHLEVLDILIKDPDVNKNLVNEHRCCALFYCSDTKLAELLLDNGADPYLIDRDDLRKPIDAVLECIEKDKILSADLRVLASSPDAVEVLTDAQKATVARLTGVQNAKNALRFRHELDGKSLIDFMRDDKPNLFMFARGVHGNKIQFDLKLSDAEQIGNIFSSLRNNPSFIDDYNAGTNFSKQTATTKIQARIRGGIARNIKLAAKKQRIF